MKNQNEYENDAKLYSFIKKDTVSIKYFNCSRGVGDGSLNGLNDIKSKGLKVSKIRAVSQNKSGERPLIIWLKGSLYQGRIGIS